MSNGDRQGHASSKTIASSPKEQQLSLHTTELR